MEAGPVIQQLTMAILLPVALGMSLRTFAPRFVERARPVFSLLSTASLLLSLGSTVSASRPHIEAHATAVAEATMFTVALNVALYVAGTQMIRLVGLAREDAVTVLFASGMRNMGAAMVVAAVAFPDSPLVAIPAAVFSISQQLLGGAMTSMLVARPHLLDAIEIEPEASENDVIEAANGVRQRLSTYPSVHPPPL